MSILVAPSGESLQGEGLVWLNGMRVLSGAVNNMKGNDQKQNLELQSDVHSGGAIW